MRHSSVAEAVVYVLPVQHEVQFLCVARAKAALCRFRSLHPGVVIDSKSFESLTLNLCDIVGVRPDKGHYPSL